MLNISTGKKIFILFLTSFLMTLGVFGYYFYQGYKEIEESSNKNEVAVDVPKEDESVVTEPIQKSASRITKKPFGIYITLANSPVQPERFTGFHTGTDFEVEESELQKDIIIKAICAGQIVRLRDVSGYGGTIVQECDLDGEKVTVLYGHISLSKTKVSELDKVQLGDEISFLGADKSNETDGERKHLHLSIHKGTKIEYAGYVANEFQLDNWIDIEDYL